MESYCLFASHIFTSNVNINLNHNVEYVGNVSKNRRILNFEQQKIFLNEFDKIAKVFNYPNQFKITTSWFTKTLSTDSVRPFHNHRNSFYSGIYYFDNYSSNTASIEFQSPIKQLNDFYIAPTKYHLQNSPFFNIKPSKNLLLFFPSYLEHTILNHNDTQPRYSLSFNIVPIGQYGEGDSTYNTSWMT